MGTIRQTNPVREQVLGTPQALKTQFWELEDRVRKLFTDPEIFAVRHVVLCGCGDSYMAGRAAKMAFEMFCGIPTSASRAMEAGRYEAIALAGQHPDSPLVIGISSSGEVARTFEATQRFSAQGALTVALTSRPDSRVGKAARKVLKFEPASLPAAPGFYSFAASVVALYLVAVRLGEVRGHVTQDEAGALRKSIEAQIATMSQAIHAVDDAVRQLAEQWAAFENLEFLGSGPSFAAAQFGAAKILEATGFYAAGQDLEEWAHLQYFVAKPEKTATFLVVPSGSAAMSRALEIANVLETLERPSVALTGAESVSDFPGKAVGLPAGVPEVFSVFHYAVPLTLYAGYLADAVGAQYGRGHTGRWADSAEGTTIRDSQVLE